jgi:hypothetical protein
MAAQEGVVVRRGSRSKDTGTGYPEAQSKDAGRRTGTGSEVWYIRDEWARDHEVLHLHWGVLYKSGVYALKVTCLTLGGLSCVLLFVRLRIERSILIAWEKSAEGIVGIKQAKLVRHSNAERRRNGYAEP